MTRKKYCEVKFDKTKYIVFQVETIENIYYDIEKYNKKYGIWFFDVIKSKEKNFEHLRFYDMGDVLKFIFN